MKNIHKRIGELNETTAALAMALSLKQGVKNKNIAHCAVLESEIGKFPDKDLEAFGGYLMRLQGYDLNYFRSQSGTEIYFEIFPIKNDRLFIIVIAFE